MPLQSIFPQVRAGSRWNVQPHMQCFVRVRPRTLGTNGDKEVTCSLGSQKNLPVVILNALCMRLQPWEDFMYFAEFRCIFVGQVSARLHTNTSSCADLRQGQKKKKKSLRAEPVTQQNQQRRE